ILSISIMIAFIIMNIGAINADMSSDVLIDEDFLDEDFIEAYTYYETMSDLVSMNYLHIEVTCNAPLNVYLFNSSEIFFNWRDYQPTMGYQYNLVTSLDIYLALHPEHEYENWIVVLDNGMDVYERTRNGHIKVSAVDEIPSSGQMLNKISLVKKFGPLETDISSLTIPENSYQAWWITFPETEATVVVSFTTNQQIDFFLATEEQFNSWRQGGSITPEKSWEDSSGLSEETFTFSGGGGIYWFVFDNSADTNADIESISFSITSSFTESRLFPIPGFEIVFVLILPMLMIVARAKNRQTRAK
ncbi:MAG: hypothetical protein ACXAEU_10190, partial [Candidatus Hodarchaeales archaeon]